jgi:hypothetical protein
MAIVERERIQLEYDQLNQVLAEGAALDAETAAVERSTVVERAPGATLRRLMGHGRSNDAYTVIISFRKNKHKAYRKWYGLEPNTDMNTYREANAEHGSCWCFAEPKGQQVVDGDVYYGEFELTIADCMCIYGVVQVLIGSREGDAPSMLTLATYQGGHQPDKFAALSILLGAREFDQVGFMESCHVADEDRALSIWNAGSRAVAGRDTLARNTVLNDDMDVIVGSRFWFGEYYGWIRSITSNWRFRFTNV